MKMDEYEATEVVKPSKKQIIFEANTKIAKLEEEIKRANDSKESYYKQLNECRSQIDEIHDFLDGLPNVMPRQKTNGYSENKVSTRLLSWIASKASL
jgi:chromosome segregation ATPase